MKIAIFGDSFAHPHKDAARDTYDRSWPSWTELVEQKYGKDNFFNFSLNGTGFWYSYAQYKHYHEQYDKVIFLISNPDRIWFNDRDIDPEWMQHASPEWSQGRWKDFIKSDINYTLKQYLNNLDNYYALYHDRLKEEEFCRLATKDLKNERGDDILFISCFQDQLVFSDPGQTVELKWFMDQEEEHWGIDYYADEHEKYFDGRLCHMAQENNIMLFNKVEKWIQTSKFSLNKTDFKKPMLPWSDYAIPWKKLKHVDLS